MGSRKVVQLRFREVDRDIFDFVLSGEKKVETRAATKKFLNIESGDTIRCVCGKDRLEKKVKKVKIFKSVESLLKEYRPKEINPKALSRADLEKMYDSFPDYREKIKKCGLIVFELE